MPAKAKPMAPGQATLKAFFGQPPDATPARTAPAVSPARGGTATRGSDAAVPPTVNSRPAAAAVLQSKYKRAPGKPPCSFGVKCYRKNPRHFEEADHPAHHPFFTDEPADPAATTSHLRSRIDAYCNRL